MFFTVTDTFSRRTPTARIPRTRGARWLTAVLSGLLLVPHWSAASAQVSSAPQVEEEGPSSSLVPRIENRELFTKSVKAAAEAMRQYEVLEDHPDAERVAEIGHRIALASGFDKYPFSFTVVDLAIPNAFALPAGQIFITRGMLALDLSDDQLAALMGHEVAHVTQEHFLQMRRRANLLNALAQVVTLGAVVAAANSNDDYYQGPGGYVVRDRDATADLAIAAQSTSIVLSELLLRSYSRDNEDESDEEGQRLAAAAGFDPDGARQLMVKMKTRIPQEKSYGYWQTHPFFDQRIDSAQARAKNLTTLDPAAEAELAGYRRANQRLLHDFEIEQKNREREDRASTAGRIGDEPATADADPREFLDSAALTAWPRGAIAESILTRRLHRARDTEFERLPSSRDYGQLIRRYEQLLQRLEAGADSSEPPGPAASDLQAELSELREEVRKLEGEAVRIFEAGVYETSFLESFLSNYPDSEHRRRAALQLGVAYSRLGRESEAVSHFLIAWDRGADSPESTVTEDEIAAAAARGLRGLAPVLQQLAALEQLATQDEDEALGELAARRLDEQAGRFEDLENGAAYLDQFPDGLYVETVSARMDDLADVLYREMVLYQQIGDSAKAIARASKILELAPLSPSARKLSQQLEDQDVEG